MEQWKSFEKFEVEEERIFQQNNATQWFEDNNIQVLVLPWPAQSPDLNPIECLWVHLKKKLRDYPTLSKLWKSGRRVEFNYSRNMPKTYRKHAKKDPSSY